MDAKYALILRQRKEELGFAEIAVREWTEAIEARSAAIRERLEVEWINDKAGPYWHCRDPRCDGRWTDPLAPVHAAGCRALAAERVLAALPKEKPE